MPISLGELLRQQFPPENHLVGSGLLDYNSLMVLGGPPKAYKSFILATLAIQLATGTPLFLATRRDNHSKDQPAFPVRKQCRVLFIEQEVGLMDMQTRLGTMIQGLAAADTKLCEQNIIVESCNRDVRLDLVSGRDLIASYVEQWKPDVLILDPLREFHQRNENDATEMASTFGNLDWLRHKYGFATILSHHTRKEGRDEHAEGPDLLRGSSYVFGKADTFLIAKPASRKQPGLINVDFTIRRGKPISSLQLIIDSVNLRMKFSRWMAGSEREKPEYGESQVLLQ